MPGCGFRYRHDRGSQGRGREPHDRARQSAEVTRDALPLLLIAARGHRSAWRRPQREPDPVRCGSPPRSARRHSRMRHRAASCVPPRAHVSSAETGPHRATRSPDLRTARRAASCGAAASAASKCAPCRASSANPDHAISGRRDVELAGAGPVHFDEIRPRFDAVVPTLTVSASRGGGGDRKLHLARHVRVQPVGGKQPVGVESGRRRRRPCPARSSRRGPARTGHPVLPPGHAEPHAAWCAAHPARCPR